MVLLHVGALKLMYTQTSPRGFAPMLCGALKSHCHLVDDEV